MDTKERNLMNDLYDRAMEEIGLGNIIIGLSLGAAVGLGSGLLTMALYFKKYKRV